MSFFEIHADLPLNRYLRFLLRGQYAEAGEEVPRFDPEDYRRIGRRFRAACDRPTYFPDPRHFAFVQHIATICWPVSGECYGEVNDNCEILYSCKGGPRAWGLRIYHGLAHWILREWYAGEYEESDAWLLTIELACLGDYLLEVGPERVTDENLFVPAWLVRMYYAELRMAA